MSAELSGAALGAPMTTARMTGGQAVVKSLVDEGIDVVFGLPGVQLDWLFDALFESRAAIEVIHTRHEQAAAYMADGFARTTGRVGVCVVVPGPGVLNASAGLATAYACSSPVLCLTGQVDSHAIDGGFGLLHEVPHQRRLLASLTSWSGCALAVADVPALVREAFARLRRGRPRPVALELPPDVLQASDSVRIYPPAAVPAAPLDIDALRLAADLLRGAERPVIYSGGGTLAAAAWTELQTLAELLEAPVVMSVDGRGAVSDRHDLGHTGVSGQALVKEADVVLAVGTRFWQPARVWGLHPAAKTVRIDVDAAEIDRLGAPSVALVGDAGAALRELVSLLDGLPARRARRSELRRRKLAAEDQLNAYQPQAAFARALRSALPDDAITVNDLTQVTFFGTVGFPVYQPRTFIGPGYQGTLGAAFPTALGAQVGQPDRAVVTIAGDGGFMYAIAELATQRQRHLPVVSIVFNDNAFGNVKRTQERLFGGRVIASDLVNPDFVRLAQSFGIDSERVASPDALEGALTSALAARRPALIEVSVGPMSNPWPLLAAAGGVYPLVLPTTVLGS
jgi:acetolactate synthase I/II/III large subunit